MCNQMYKKIRIWTDKYNCNRVQVVGLVEWFGVQRSHSEMARLHRLHAYCTTIHLAYGSNRIAFGPNDLNPNYEYDGNRHWLEIHGDHTVIHSIH